MAFYAGKMIQHPAMANPTLVILTDRNDLDDQLFSTFAACADLLRQNPVQAENREHLQELLSVASGSVVFTTIQKFSTENEKYPQLSDRRNIVFIADEAHRSQYGLKAKVVVKPAQQKGKVYPLKPRTSLLAAEASSSYQLHNNSLTQSEGDRAYTSYGFAKYLRDALELLNKLLNDEIKTRSRKNQVQSRSFSQMLEQTIRRYQNRSIEAAQVIAELIDLAKEIRAAQQCGEDLGLTEDELAFYDALEVNDSAVQLLGDETLQAMLKL